jgi:uncharacterized protein (TIGR02453 family)
VRQLAACTPVGEFRGFPADATAFFDELEAHNDRAWWQANKARFEASVRDPMRALLADLEPRHGTFHAFRMHRDTRFSKDKSPYKTAHAAAGETEGGVSLYVQLDRTGLFVGGGVYHPMRDQLARYRQALLDDATGPALVDAVAAARANGVDVTAGGETLRTAPRGVPRDHPRLDLLRWKGCIVSRALGSPRWLGTPAALARVEAVWAAGAPVLRWLEDHVGPSEEPPPER